MQQPACAQWSSLVRGASRNYHRSQVPSKQVVRAESEGSVDVDKVVKDLQEKVRVQLRACV